MNLRKMRSAYQLTIGCLGIQCLLLIAQIEAKPIDSGFGKRQVDQMLADRRDMQDAVAASHPVRVELARCFEGIDAGQRIYWVNKLPSSGKAATHAQPYLHFPPHIALTNSPKVDAIDKWALALFEVYNVNGDFVLHCKNAAAGNLTREQFVDNCLELEVKALKKTRVFLLNNPLPSNPKSRWYQYFISKRSRDVSEQDEIDIRRSNARYFMDYYDSLSGQR